MKTTVSIAGQVIDWAAARFRPGAVARNWGGAPDEFEFTADSCGPMPPWPPGVEVRVTLSADDGSDPFLAFVGDTGRASSRQPDRWSHAYNCQGLKARGDRVTITAPDGSGEAMFNLPLDDPMYLPTSAGKTVGQILAAVFEVPATVAQLAALGIGNFTPAGKLPAATAADFAALDVVPPRPVILAGRGLFNQAEDLIAERHPDRALWVDPDGTIRCKDMFGLPARTITLPSDTSIGTDPAADGLAIDVDASECYSAVRLTGVDVVLLQRSLRNGGLAPAWSTVDELGGGPNNLPRWTILDTQQPRDSAAQGDASNVTSTSVTVHCDDPTQKWAAQYWPAVQGRLYLEMTNVLPGVVASESHKITACTALSPGGTSVITVDSVQPIESGQYDRFRIVGEASPRAVVGRLYSVLGIPEGYSLYPMFPVPQVWMHLAGLDLIRTPRAVVQHNGFHLDKPPFFEQGVTVQVDVLNKRILLAQPAAALSADAQVLQSRYPVSIADGLPADLIVALPAFRGALDAYAPAGGGHAGLGHSMFGITRVWTLAVPEFTDRSQLDGYQRLAEERLKVLRDPVFGVSARHVDWPADFNPLATAYAYQFSVPGAPTQVDGIPIPCRSTRLEWHQEGDLLRSVTYQCSNNRRAGGDDQYTHPAFGQSGFGLPYLDEGGFSAGGPAFLGLDEFNARSSGAMGATLEGSNAAFNATAAGSAANFDATTSGAGAAFDAVVGSAGLPPASLMSVAGMGGPGFGDFGLGVDSGGDFDAGPAPRARKGGRQRGIDETAAASRALRSPEENAEKHRLAQAILNPAPEPKAEAPMPEPPVGSSMTDTMLAEQAKRRRAAPPVEAVPGLRSAASANSEDVTVRSAPSADSDPARRLVESARPPESDRPLSLRERRRRGLADLPEGEV